MWDWLRTALAQTPFWLLPLVGLVWLDTAGKLLLDAAGRVLLCDDCPCTGSGGNGTPGCECCNQVSYPPKATLYFTIINRSGCACLDGLSGAIAQTGPGLQDWSNSPGIANGCSGSFVLHLQCTASQYRLNFYCSPVAQAQSDCSQVTVFSCDPFHLYFSGVAFPATLGACCSGTVDVEITE